MLRLASYDIVFQEIPGEVTLALNLSCCPNRCQGCHSPQLQEDIGEILSEGLLLGLLEGYGTSVTCVCFMGGDNDPAAVEQLALQVRDFRGKALKTGWYSGRTAFPSGISFTAFNYVKLGPYIAHLGGLNSPTTNQRFYKVENGAMSDHTYLFGKSKKSERL